MNSRFLIGALALVVATLLLWELRWVLLILFGSVVLAVALDVRERVRVHVGLVLRVFDCVALDDRDAHPHGVGQQVARAERDGVRDGLRDRHQ